MYTHCDMRIFNCQEKSFSLLCTHFHGISIFMLIDKFQDPPAENRPRPFWFFNGDMEREEVRRQVLEMKKQGLGGFFLCARQGLRVPYLSSDWFELARYTVGLARENGLEVWLYDEYPYPSGMSGGEVTIRHPEAKQKILELRYIDLEEGAALNESLGEGSLLLARAWPLSGEEPCWEKGEDIAAHCGILQNQEIYQVTEGGVSYRHNLKRYFTYGPSKELRWKPSAGRRKVLLAFTRELEDFKYYKTFLDPANEKAVQCFIDTTYEPYRAALGGDFGKTVKGMFGDETGFLGRWPWSPELPEYFQKKYGVSLVENLAALVDSSWPASRRVRYRYFQCVHELLRDRYHKPLSEWCEKNGISYVTEVPSVRMSNQMYSHVPGGDPCHDKLGFPFGRVVDRDFHYPRQNPKVISAMARQFNRRDSLIESFHSMGWTTTLQDVKWQIDRQTVMGVSLHNFHAYYYTVNGITKHDAPPSHFIQNPYWEYYKTFADYCGRSSRFITETEASISVAILHPAIVWCGELRNPFAHFNYVGRDQAEDELGRRLVDDYKYICKTMFFNQIDYEDLDPEVMAMGRIENGAILVGRARYTTLVVPPITFIEKYAFDLVRRFIEGGGKVIFAGVTPWDSVDEGFDPIAAFQAAGFGLLPRDAYFGPAGQSRVEKKSERVALLAAPGGLAASGAGEELAKLLRDFAPVNAEVLVPEELREGIIAHRREKGDVRFVMLASQDGAAAETKILFRDCPLDAAFYELDLETGLVSGVSAKHEGDANSVGEGCRLVDAPLSPWSARIFAMAGPGQTVSAALSSVQAFTRPPEKTLRLKLDLDRQLPFSIGVAKQVGGLNVYRLEELTVSIGKGAAFKSKPNTFIEHLKKSGSLTAEHIKFGDGFGIPQRLSMNYPQQAAYHFEFTIERELFAAKAAGAAPLKFRLLRDRMGIMGGHTMVINRRELPADAWKPFRVYDQNNIAADITPFLRAGPNTLDVYVTATEDWHGLSDPMYLLGNFGVFCRGGKFIIGKAPLRAFPSAKAVEGYPFYSGKFFFGGELQAENPGKYERFTVELPEKHRIYECVELSVNDHDLGLRGFSPYVWQGPASLLRQGANPVKLTIANTLGNMFEGCYYDYEEHKTVFIGAEEFNVSPSRPVKEKYSS